MQNSNKENAIGMIVTEKMAMLCEEEITYDIGM
jgi:hypothetical protein